MQKSIIGVLTLKLDICNFSMWNHDKIFSFIEVIETIYFQHHYTTAESKSQLILRIYCFRLNVNVLGSFELVYNYQMLMLHLEKLIGNLY